MRGTVSEEVLERGAWWSLRSGRKSLPACVESSRAFRVERIEDE